jgi:CheY-like chemotaxis protein
MRVLIAEDDPVNHALLKSLVADWGHTVVAVNDGAQAWEHLRREGAPTLALIDWMLPKMTGPEIIKNVRALPLPIRPYLLLLTSRDDPHDVVAGLRCGASDYIVKPFNVDELQARFELGVQNVTLQKQVADRVRELEGVLAHVRRLQGLLPICVYCKKIRDDRNYWRGVENYLSENAEVHFTHSVCPDCLQRAKRQARTEETGDAGPAKPKGQDPGRTGAVATPMGRPTGDGK